MCKDKRQLVVVVLPKQERRRQRLFPCVCVRVVRSKHEEAYLTELDCSTLLCVVWFCGAGAKIWWAAMWQLGW